MILALKNRFPCIFSISRLTASLGLVIIIAASFMRQVYNFARSLVPVSIMSIGIWLGFLVVIGGLLYLISKRPRMRNLVTLSLASGVAVWLALSMDLIEERVHILTYGFLAFLATRDLRTWPVWPRALNALLFCVLVGCVDEIFQAMLPYRVGDIRDVFFDSVSSFLGVVVSIALQAA